MAARGRRKGKRSPWQVVPVSARTVDGKVYRSGYEAGVARSLAERGLAFDYEHTVLPYVIPKVTRVDWTIRTQSGRTILVESKGYFPPSAREKVAAIVESNPDEDYRLLFQPGSQAAKLGPALAKRLGIQWATGDSIPDAWFEED
ncbi:MAG: hypothetical protein GWO39_14865 [Gammaproteobacteria bacterium]|nr:hypothetical protein [Gemmatimonadota bacterium]NIT64980.1 hypothetical protein [Gammaproteobacteria bacterium]NIU80516.1 hypothetical protein [Gammaproteobacteria bacterium]NIV21998.1 hypothetical protein [Gammaproteobacteria bacterium]NIW77902.1 hypothetical protein [Gemmatimonadota bacterium]